MKTTVRATRGYLAGFGTSGSLLAGAAALFVLGSAIVAFRGWPQIANGPASVVVTASHPAAPSRVSRRLAAALRGDAATGGTALAPAAGRPDIGTRGSRTPNGAALSPPRSGSSPASPAGSSATAASAAAPTAGCGGSCSRPGGSSLVSRLTNTVAQEVSSIGSSVGSIVGSGSNAVGGAVNGVSPQAGSTLQGAGSNGGNIISGTSSTAAGAVSQTGSALSGGH